MNFEHWTKVFRKTFVIGLGTKVTKLKFNTKPIYNNFKRDSLRNALYLFHSLKYLIIFTDWWNFPIKYVTKSFKFQTYFYLICYFQNFTFYLIFICLFNALYLSMLSLCLIAKYNNYSFECWNNHNGSTILQFSTKTCSRTIPIIFVHPLLKRKTVVVEIRRHVFKMSLCTYWYTLRK